MILTPNWYYIVIASISLSVCTSINSFYQLLFTPTKVREYDQEVPQSHTADYPMA